MVTIIIFVIVILMVRDLLLLELGLQVIESVVLVDIVVISNDTSPTSTRAIILICMSSSTIITS